MEASFKLPAEEKKRNINEVLLFFKDTRVLNNSNCLINYQNQ